jgi:hypothetical protein
LFASTSLLSAVRRQTTGTDVLSTGLGAYLSLGILIVIPLTAIGSAVAWVVAVVSVGRRGRASGILFWLAVFIELACNSIYMLCAVPSDIGSVSAALAFAVLWSLVLPVAVMWRRRRDS